VLWYLTALIIGVASAVTELFTVRVSWFGKAYDTYPSEIFGIVLLAFLLTSAGFAFFWLARTLLGGVFGQHRLIDAIDRGLSAQLGRLSPQLKALLEKESRERTDPHQPIVRFRHLTADPNAGALPLSVVATDIVDKKIKILSCSTTPDVSVAEAVAASMAMPVLFKPASVSGVGQGRFFDGAFRSNYPIWAFDAERTVDADLQSIGISIKEELEPKDVPRDAFAAIRALIVTTMFGDRQLETRFSRNIPVEFSPGKARLLDLDMRQNTASSMIDDAYYAFRGTMRDRARRRAMRSRTAMDIRELVLAMKKQGRNGGVVRVALLEAELARSVHDPKYLRTAWVCSSEKVIRPVHIDDRIRYSIAESLPGRAWLEDRPHWEPELWRSGRHDPRLVMFHPTRQRYEQALLWPAARWCIAVPVRAGPNRAIGWVIYMDGDQPVTDFEFDDALGSPGDRPNGLEFNKLADVVRENALKLYSSDDAAARAMSRA
jgi:predicted acylesterase/phospholipase RssA